MTQKRTRIALLVLCIGLITTVAIGVAFAQPLLPANYYGNVTVEGTNQAPPAPIVVEAVVDGEVEDSIEVETSLPYNLGGPAADDPKLEVQEPEDGDEVEFQVIGEVVHTVEWEQGPQEIDIEVDEELVTPNLTVAITDTNSPIDVGEDVVVDATIENEGAVDETGEIELRFNNETRDTDSLFVESQATENVSLSFEAGTDDVGVGNLTVATPDSEDSVEIEVLEPVFETTITGTNDPVQGGDDLVVDVSVENVGGASGTQELALLDADGTELDTTTVSIDPGESIDSTLAWTTSNADVGEHTLTVTSDDSEDAVSVTVEESDDLPPAPQPGEPVSSVPISTDPADIMDIPDDVDVLGGDVWEITTDEAADIARAEFTGTVPIESMTWATADVSGEVGVVELSAAPSVTGSAPGTTVAVTQIGLPDGADDHEMTIDVRVSHNQLNDSGIDTSEDLRLVGYDANEEQWKTLETFRIEDNDADVVVRAAASNIEFLTVSATTPPTAAFDVEPTELEVGEEITLDAAQAADQYGEIARYEWTVGTDEHTGDEVTTTIGESGEIDIELRVTNDAGLTDTAVDTVTAVQPFEPSIELDAPATVDAGDDMDLTVSVSNLGEVSGTEQLTVAVDGTIEADEAVELDGGETDDRTVTVSAPDVDSDSTITIEAAYGDVEESLSVDVDAPDTDGDDPDDADEPPADDDGDGTMDFVPGFGFVVALISIVGLALFARFRRSS